MRPRSSWTVYKSLVYPGGAAISHALQEKKNVSTQRRHEMGTDLGSFQRVDQTVLAYIWKSDHADRHALCCARLVSFQEPKLRWCRRTR